MSMINLPNFAWDTSSDPITEGCIGLPHVWTGFRYADFTVLTTP